MRVLLGILALVTLAASIGSGLTVDDKVINVIYTMSFLTMSCVFSSAATVITAVEGRNER